MKINVPHLRRSQSILAGHAGFPAWAKFFRVDGASLGRGSSGRSDLKVTGAKLQMLK
jgi:hypothetical protein